MDEAVIKLAEQLQLRLKQLDVVGDRATFDWVHGFLIALLEQIEKSIPALALKQLSSSESDRDELERLAKKAQARLDRLDDPDSLERIERELKRELKGSEPDDPAGVPAKRKPGPKGLSGGAAVPLPYNDIDM